jgi:serine protease Do
VVDGADEIKVLLEKDKKEYTAKVVGRDPKTDIAVLKIEASSLPAIVFGDSDHVEVGDVVLAIGNPFGLGQTVTAGIVSAVGRGGMGIEDYEDFIQTDASINPGNSGGALVDATGRLVGINTAILSQSGGNHGVGFAVPANLARSVMDALIKHGKVVRGYLGISIQDVTPELAKQFHLAESKGALVSEVTERSAAEEAGIKSGDIITEFAGKSVPDSRQLKLMVGKTAPGTRVEVRLLRDGKEKDLKVTLKEMAEKQIAATPRGGKSAPGETLQGVAVSDLTPAMRRQYNLPPGLKGAVITEVDAATAAFEAGLRPGMVLQEINRQPVYNAEDAVRSTTNVKDKTTLVKVWWNGGSRFLVVNEEKTS